MSLQCVKYVQVKSLTSCDELRNAEVFAKEDCACNSRANWRQKRQDSRVGQREVLQGVVDSVKSDRPVYILHRVQYECMSDSPSKSSVKKEETQALGSEDRVLDSSRNPIWLNVIRFRITSYGQNVHVYDAAGICYHLVREGVKNASDFERLHIPFERR